LLPDSFTLVIRSLGGSTYELTATQLLPLQRERAFTFFEDPRNLVEITPGWLRFVMKDREQMTGMLEGAEFDYTIRWFGIPMTWKSRITGYRPPERFTDIQVAGPYRSWSHLHTFEEAPGGTRMTDIVAYRLPFGPLGKAVHGLAVRRQLEDIFCYRALRVDAWARSELQRTGNAAVPQRTSP
jgi:ligand-binding SRPBCC domain-containing protein